MNSFNLHIVQQRLAETKRVLPIVLSKQAENYFTGSFTKQGLGTDKWQEVNRRIAGTNEYKYPKFKGLSRRTKPILIGTGALRRKVSNSIRTATWDNISLIVDLPYASVHNEGGTISVASHSRAQFFKTKIKSFNGLKLNKKGQYKQSFSTRTIEIRKQDANVSGHTKYIPARPFMKQTPELTILQRKKITQHLDKIWQGQ